VGSFSSFAVMIFAEHGRDDEPWIVLLCPTGPSSEGASWGVPLPVHSSGGGTCVEDLLVTSHWVRAPASLDALCDFQAHLFQEEQWLMLEQLLLSGAS